MNWILLICMNVLKSLRPLEMSSKRRPSKREQIPVHLRGKRKIVDPRFNEQFGEYDAKEFRESYHFITDMRRQELKVRRKITIIEF